MDRREMGGGGYGEGKTEKNEELNRHALVHRERGRLEMVVNDPL